MSSYGNDDQRTFESICSMIKAEKPSWVTYPCTADEMNKAYYHRIPQSIIDKHNIIFVTMGPQELVEVLIDAVVAGLNIEYTDINGLKQYIRPSEINNVARLWLLLNGDNIKGMAGNLGQKAGKGIKDAFTKKGDNGHTPAGNVARGAGGLLVKGAKGFAGWLDNNLRDY